MAGIRDQENIEALKKRLYDRGTAYVRPERHQLNDQSFDVARGWAGIGEAKTDEVVSPNSASLNSEPNSSDASIATSSEAVVHPLLGVDSSPAASASDLDLASKTKPRRRYRIIILLISIGFFILTTLISSLYLMLGNNQISAQNISLTLTTPFSLAGGEVAEINVGLTNQNPVALEAATLIVNYPAGTRSADGENRELFEERIPLAGLEPRQAINIPLRAILFGEENEEKEVKVALEYRVAGSNGNFFKEAEPERVRITSSPLVAQVLSVDRISSGQELEVKILLRSNANVSQNNILVNASYPNSFTFVRSEPAPDFAQTGWLVREIKPEETKEIIIRGRVSGLSDEAGEIQVRIGTPRSDNQFLIGSLLSQARTSYVIERPFMDISVSINEDSDGLAILPAGQEANVRVAIRNSLSEPIYDARLEIKLEGNLIRDDRVIVGQGIFDRATGLIRIDVAAERDLEQINPGETREFTFRVLGDAGQGAANFNVAVNVFARRVNEARAAEVLVGNVKAEAKYTSQIALASQVGYGDGPFNDTGGVPPVAETATTYTLTLVATAGVNDMTDGSVTFTLPQYVDWTDQVIGDGKIEFNPVAKQGRWQVGDIRARERKQIQFQVRLTPTNAQVGQTVSLISAQELRAEDRFTGVPLRAGALALTSELSTELGFVNGNGVVQPRAQ